MSSWRVSGIGVCTCIRLGVALLLSAHASAAAGQGEKGLQSFYVVQGADFYGHDVISVEAVGQDVRVRVITVAGVDENCPDTLVQAVERILPHTTVQTVAGVPLCSISDDHVAHALARADSHRNGVDFFGSTETLVANCGGRDKKFSFHQPPIIDDDKLRQDRFVFRMFEMGTRLTALANEGAHPPPTQEQRNALGLSLVPELTSGKYQTALPGGSPNFFAEVLQGYHGPPTQQRGLLPPELVDRDSLGLTTYAPARYPQIALSARIVGDVHLRLTADPESGAVTTVEIVSGSPLLTEAAATAARGWRFAPAKAPREPIEVVVRFQRRCPSD